MSELRQRKAASSKDTTDAKAAEASDDASPPTPPPPPAQPPTKKVDDGSGLKSEGNKGIDRHRLLRGARTAFFLVLLPTAYSLLANVEAQSTAVDTWQRSTKCVVHKSEVFDGTDKRTLFAKGSNWKLRVLYSYIGHSTGMNLTSTRVYYYNNVDDQPGRTKSYADKVEAHLKKHGCHAFVNPAKETEAILIREVSFKPYGHLLSFVALSLMFLWYLFLEHDWAGRTPMDDDRYPPLCDAVTKRRHDSRDILEGAPDDAGRFEQHQSDPEYEASKKEKELIARTGLDVGGDAAREKVTMEEIDDYEGGWFVLLHGCGIRGWAEMAFGAAAVAVWHAAGYYSWADYTKRFYPVGNAEELRLLYHIVGAAMALRVVYFVTLVLRVQDLQVYVDRDHLEMGSPFALIFKQPRRSALVPVTYEKVRFKFTLYETEHGPRKGNAPNRKVLKLHEEVVEILQQHTVPKDKKGVVEVVPFAAHVAQVKEDGLSEEGRQKTTRVYYKWQLEMQVSLTFTPLSCNVLIPLQVTVPDEFKVGDDYVRVRSQPDTSSVESFLGAASGKRRKE
eukprot:Rhum_TRINITY_DN3042_c0_g1::Rhum_TRINITY_DN3042_c0_g1_i1::g.9154::m.9154